MNVSARIKVFEVRRVILEVQNRPQEMKNNDVEEDRTRRGEKKDDKDNRKRQYELSECFASVWPGNKGKVGRAVWSAEAPRQPMRSV